MLKAVAAFVCKKITCNPCIKRQSY